jgi:diguanylate cyclase (GGDEF)-like protein
MLLDIVTVLDLYITALFAGSLCFLYLQLRSLERDGLFLLSIAFFEIGTGFLLTGVGEKYFFHSGAWSFLSLLAGIAGYGIFYIGISSLNYTRHRMFRSIIFIFFFLVLAAGFFLNLWCISRIRYIFFHMTASFFLYAAACEVFRKTASEPLTSRKWLGLSILVSASVFLFAGIGIIASGDYAQIIARGFYIQIICIFMITIFIFALVKERVEIKLKQASEIDMLTGIGNRRWFYSRVPRNMHLHDAFFIIDLDYFKRINDVYGHLGGDKVLIAVAGTISSLLRSHDILARYGGEEFIVYLPDTCRSDAAIIADRIRKGIEDLLVDYCRTQICVTASIGVACNNQPCASLESMMEYSDKALYAVKKSGRNGFEIISV